MLTFKIVDYVGSGFTSFTIDFSALPAPNVNDAVLNGSDYFIVLHKVVNEADTYLVSPLLTSPPSL